MTGGKLRSSASLTGTVASYTVPEASIYGTLDQDGNLNSRLNGFAHVGATIVHGHEWVPD